MPDETPIPEGAALAFDTDHRFATLNNNGEIVGLWWATRDAAELQAQGFTEQRYVEHHTIEVVTTWRTQTSVSPFDWRAGV
jgi:hypothetical protein